MKPAYSSKKRLFAFVLISVLLLSTQLVKAQADNCAGAGVLSVFTGVCLGATAGTTGGATQSMPGCVGNADDDVWYQFVQDGGSPTITVTSPAVAGRITDIVFEVFSGGCGSLTSILCMNNTAGTSTETATLNNLVNGATYYVRVYSFGIGGANAGNYTICITKPVSPINNNCVLATLLTPQATCVGGIGGSSAAGNLVNATNSLLPAGVCGGVAADDVWYSFVAGFNTHTITMSGIGSAIAVNGTGIGGRARLEVFSSSNNTCGGVLSNIACGAISGNNLIAYANSLTVGNTYFIRVYSTNSISLNANAGFNICVQNPYVGPPTLGFGKSFINVTKGNGGGTVETGDILEIRAVISLRNPTLMDSCAFFDNIPAGTSYIPGTLAILTNEGKVYKSFTDAAGDDAGHVLAGAVRINMGFNTGDNTATAFRRGRLRHNNVPLIGGGSLMMASYRVSVTASTNSILSLGGGSFTYSLVNSPTSIVSTTFNTSNVVVYTDNGLCTDATGVNILDNGLAGDFDGTFGSGNTINRIASPNLPAGYSYVTQNGSQPGDTQYTISNNTSRNAAGFSTVNTWPKPESPAVHRIFGVFDVIGDHTNATDQLAGNPAADTTNGGIGGYMLLVNASYNIDTAFKYPISGLCPSTYYELSFWVRNVCSRCGIDSLGRGASGISVPAGYIPTDVGDSSGVYPNLSLSVDGINHYTTGNIRYTGQWIKKGFVFLTGPAQTSIVFAITNNAPGGGGNDWALDDIRVSTCTPVLNLVPNGNSNVCYGNQVDMNVDVISYFNNYVYYQWQVSRDNGVTWTDTLAMGTGSPTLSGGNYVYNAAFPSFLADSSQHRVQYRIRVATSPANLTTGCSFFNSATILVLVDNCTWLLNTNIVSFDGVIKDKHGVLRWKGSNETASTEYELQKSLNGRNFYSIAKIKALDHTDDYTYTDPEILSPSAYYRLLVREASGKTVSKVVLLTTSGIQYDIISAINPFREKIVFEVVSPTNSMGTVVITDQHGKVLKQMRYSFTKGINQVNINDMEALPVGSYILQVITPSGIKSKKLVKVQH